MCWCGCASVRVRVRGCGRGCARVFEFVSGCVLVGLQVVS